MSQTAYPTPLSGPCHSIIPAEGSNQLAVFFGAKDLAPGKFNFYQIGQDLGCNVIFLNNGENHWYQYGIPGLGDGVDDTLATLRAWSEALNAPDMTFFGSSMGSYGALQFGAALGARVLCFATDAMMNTPHSSSARFFTGKTPVSCPDLTACLPGASSEIVLFFGETDVADLQAAKQLAAIDSITVTTLQGVGHYVPTYLSAQGRLMPMIRAFVAGKLLASSQEAGAALISGDYVEQTFVAFCAAADKDYAGVLEAANKALADYPHGEAALLLKGEALFRLQDHAAAIPVLQAALTVNPDHAETLQLLATCLRHTGHLPQARAVLHRIIRNTPSYAKAHYALGLVQSDESDLPAALRSFQMAVRLEPSNKTFKDRVALIRKRM